MSSLSLLWYNECIYPEVEFKNYIIGMVFYDYLSDRTEKYMENLLKDDHISYENAWEDEE